MIIGGGIAFRTMGAASLVIIALRLVSVHFLH